MSKISVKLFIIGVLFLGFGVYFNKIGNEIENNKYKSASIKYQEQERVKKLKGESVFNHSSINYNRQLNWAEYLAILFFVVAGANFLAAFWIRMTNTQPLEDETVLFEKK